mgnify:CR=1 FL=1
MTVGCVKILFGKGFFCFPKSNQFAMKEQDLVKISWDLAQIVMDNQDGLAFLFQGLECLHDDVFADRVKSLRRAHPKK